MRQTSVARTQRYVGVQRFTEKANEKLPKKDEFLHVTTFSMDDLGILLFIVEINDVKKVATKKKLLWLHSNCVRFNFGIEATKGLGNAINQKIYLKKNQKKNPFLHIFAPSH